VGVIGVKQLPDVLTTGQVARLCRVAPRTVSKWFDSGQLRGYRIPGSRDRRIPLQQLVRFMKVHGMPLTGLETGQMRVLVVDNARDLTELLQQSLAETANCEVRVAESVFEAGALVEQFRPRTILMEMDLPGADGRIMSRYLSSRPELHGTQLIAMGASMTEADRQTLLQQGFSRTLAKPFHIRQVAELIAEVQSAGSGYTS
jgi:excisionase family DNA binding protein